MDIRNFFGGGKKKTPKKKPDEDEATDKKSATNNASTEAAAAASNNTNSADAKKSKSEEKTLTMEERRRRALEDSDDDDDDQEPPPKKKPAVSSPKKKTAAAAAPPTRTSPRNKRHASPVKKEEKKRRIYESSSDDDDDENNDDDKMDEDFRNDDQEESDDGDDDDDFEEEQPKPKQSSKKAPTKKRVITSPTKKQTKKIKVEETTVSVSAAPPKYHPPTSQIINVIPFLKNNPSIQIQSNTNIKLVTKGKSLTEAFNVDNMTPLCLENLTFVFTGVLTTNTAKSTLVNTNIAMASPTKGEYYNNRNAYTTSITDGIGSNEELPRDIASDIIKMLGGRVTGSVSGKTDYLVCGSILEDGRAVEEGSKYRKCLELYEVWGNKYRSDYNNNDNDEGEETTTSKKKKGKKATTKGSDPNSLVEIINGVDEFWGLINFMSEWKRGTLSEEERAKLLESSQSNTANTTVKKEDEAKSSVQSAPAAPLSNPYAQKKPANPYAKTPALANPYAKTTAPANPYAKPANPYAKKATTTTTSNTQSTNTTNDKSSAPKKTFQVNALWADKYAPSNSREILGNADSVNKLFKWLNTWEDIFNNPKRRPKSISGPNGPWKAALLSGPPGIGKTTTATLVAQESNRDVIELNASDARSKKALTEALGDLSGTHAFSFGNADGSKKNNTARKRCVIMDEVDGMGAGDRSGISELIQMIKKAKVPIICICNDRSSQKMRSLVQYCMDLRYRRPTKNVIAKRAVEVGRLEGMSVEVNAAEAMSESCGNDIRQVLNCLQMWSSKKSDDNTSSSLTFKDLRERKNDINKDEVLRVSMFDACKLLVEGSRGLANADAKTATASLLKRSDAYFVDYMLMGLNVHQNYLKVALGQFNNAKLKNDDELELQALNELHEATLAMSDFGMCEDQLRGSDQNWSLLPLCSMLAVKVGHHAGGPNGGFLPGYPEFAGWLGKNSSRNKRIRVLQELLHHMNFKVSADAPELRMNYLPVMRQQFQDLLFNKDGANVTDAIELMDQYGLDRDDLFENLDEFILSVPNSKEKKFSDLDSKAKAAFTREYNKTAHTSQALVGEQGVKTGRKKSASAAEVEESGELDVVDDDKAGNEVDEEQDDEEDVEALKEMFMKKKKRASSGNGSAKTKPAKGKSKKK